MSLNVIDFEVFKEDWLCVIFDLVNQKEHVIVNDRDAFVKFYEEHKDDIFVGYNIRNYDQWIFKAILCGFDPKDVNDFIIVGRKKGHEYSRMFARTKVNIFDIMPNPPVGLKTLEGFMGENIKESSVDFTIDRKLTSNEIEEVITYCRHDVEQTCIVLSKRIEEFTSQLDLVKMFDLPASDMGKTKAQLSAKVLGATQPSKPREDDIEYCIPENLRVSKYRFVVDWFLKVQQEARDYAKEWGVEPALDELYSKKLECEIAGVPHTFAFGGIHGAIPNYHGEGYFVNVDVASYYPSMMIHFGYESRGIKDPEKFTEIYRTRLAYKKAKDKRQQPLKIVLNSTYGAMKDRYNQLFDPLMANNVCVTGQLLLLDLIEHLEGTCDIIQSNTDGILVKLRASNDDERDSEFAKVFDICQEWTRRTGMVLEQDFFTKVIQRDVNNYVIVDADGKYKSKGGVVKKLNDLDYDLPIVNRAVVSYLVKGIPVEQTVSEATDLRDFQKIVKISSKYAFGTHNGKRLNDKTFRVFASKHPEDGKICKVKSEGATEEKFANTPDCCFIDNGFVRGKRIPSYLDKSWYVDLAKKRIKEFLYGKDFKATVENSVVRSDGTYEVTFSDGTTRCMDREEFKLITE